MQKNILFILGIILYSYGFSQTTTTLTDSYQPPQTITNVEIRMLPGFHADSKNVIYRGTEFIARSKTYDSNNPNPTITNPPTAYTPSNGDNYIYTRSYLAPVTESNNYAPQVQSITYFDGLGRPKQNIAIKSTPAGNDLVTPIVYDGFGRQTLDYLPMPVSSLNGGIQPTTGSNVDSYYSGLRLGMNAYSEKKLENSPLDRILEQYGPGDDWKQKSKRVTYGYLSNEDNEVLKFVTTTSWSDNTTKSILSLGTNNYYPKSTLYKNKVTDEDDNESYEFKNGQGQTLLVRKMLTSTTSADTYYVYNEYDQLAFVISPKGSDQIMSNTGTADLSETGDILSALAYQYRYDGRNRLAEKKLPGKGWESMVYDKQDRLVLTQDANLKGNKNNFNTPGWIFTKYDVFGRVVYTGFFKNGASRTQMQTALNNMNSGNTEERVDSPSMTLQGMPLYYTRNAFPTGSMTLLSVNYYDTYPPGSPSLPVNILNQQVLTQDAQTSNISTKNLSTASYVKNIEDDNWTKNYNWYDTKARVIGTYSINHLGGYTRTESLLDFSGVTKQYLTYHKRLSGDPETIIRENFEYDYQNRLLVHKHQVNGGPEEILVQNTYNEIGQLDKKIVGSGLQEIKYAYNIRGWMTKINEPSNLNSKLFGYEIKYNKPSGGIAKYNGNISQIDWRTSNDDILRRYSYTYDNLNRLLFAQYQKPNASTPNTDAYNENVTYDINGNIKTLERFGETDNIQAIPIDKLEYFYENNNSNRLSYLKDNGGNDQSGYPLGNGQTGQTMTYDDNGNITSILDKGINTINYNFLNLPNQILENFGSLTQSYKYVYRSDGVKLKKIERLGGRGGSPANITDYLDGFQYERTLQFVPTSEGYYDFVENKYIYNYTDHLGNVRLSYSRGANGAEAIEENNYYPFGLKHEGYNELGGGNSAYNYKYNGKELQETGMYDYGARMLMTDIGRWLSVDPLAEQYTRWSPFNYGMNNPIRFIDPDGRGTEDWVKRGSQVFFDASVKSQADAAATYGENAQHLGEGSTLTTSVNGEATETYTFHDNGTVSSSNTGVMDNRFDHTTQGGTTIFASNSLGGAGAYNFGVGLGAMAIEKAPGSFRLTNGLANGSAFRPKYYGSGWAGGSRAMISTYNIGNIGKGLGYLGAGAGVVMDGIGVYNYIQNPQAPNAVSPTKATGNTGMAAWGLFGGPYGVAVSTAYGAIEAIYPGGLEGAMNDNAKFQRQLDEGVNKAGPNRVYIIPRGPK